MNIHPDADRPTREVLPGQSIQVPFFPEHHVTGANAELLKMVREKNRETAAKLNDARQQFTNLCIAQLLPPGEWDRIVALPAGQLAEAVGRHLDLAKLATHQKPTFTSPLHTVSADNKHAGTERQTGWILTLAYDGDPVGDMVVSFLDNGTINVTCHVIDNHQPTPHEENPQD